MTPLDTAIAKVHASGSAGVSFHALSDEERAYLTAGLVPASGVAFAEEIRALLESYWLVLSSEHEASITALCPAEYRLEPITLTDGTRVVGSPLLTYCGDGDPFGALRELLHDCPIRYVTTAEFPTYD